MLELIGARARSHDALDVADAVARALDHNPRTERFVFDDAVPRSSWRSPAAPLAAVVDPMAEISAVGLRHAKASRRRAVCRTCHQRERT